MGGSGTSRRKAAKSLHTLADLARFLPHYGQRRAVGLAGDFGLRWWTYEQLQQHAERCALRLAELGVGPGDRVLLWAGNGPEWVAVLLGCALRGACCAIVDAELPTSFAQDSAQQAQAKLVVHGRDQEAPAKASCPWLDLQELVWQETELGEEQDGAELPTVPLTAADPAVILYSSGTTGEPKGVLLSHGNLLSQLRPFQRYRGALRVAGARMLVLPPLSHVFGLVVGLILPLSLGLVVAYTELRFPQQWMRIIRDHRIALLVAVPRMLELLRAALLRQPTGHDGRSLASRLRQVGPLVERLRLIRWRRRLLGNRPRGILVGGARLPLSTERFWRRSGILVAQGYGQTESAAIVSVSNPFAAPGTLGRPANAGSRSADFDRELRLAEDGEILVRGPNVAVDFLDAVDDSKGPEHGFLATGDLGRIDRHGRLVFVGRKKELIVTSEGLNVHPQEVEAALGEQRGVLACAVLALEDEGSEQVHAVLVMEEGAPAADAVHAANSVLHAHQQIRGWTLWPESDLPRNRLHKVRRDLVAQRLPLLRSGTSASTRERETLPALEQIRAESRRKQRVQWIARHLLERPAQAEENELRLVEDLGLGSLDVVELLGELESQGVGRLPAVGSATTLGALRSALDVQLQSQRDPSGIAGEVDSRSGDPSPGDPSASNRRPRPRGSTLPGRQPSWALSLPVRALRRITRRSAIEAWSFLGSRPSLHWHGQAQQLEAPMLLAAYPHRHWLDAFAIYRVLPPRLRRRLFVITNRDFHQHFEPGTQVPLRNRLYMALAYYVALPALFPFTILSSFGRTREGLQETGRLIDRGYAGLSFPHGLEYWGRPEGQPYDPGVVLLAQATGRPLLPVFLANNFSMGFRWRRPRRQPQVHLGRTLEIRPGDDPDEALTRLELAHGELAAAAEMAADESVDTETSDPELARLEGGLP